MTWNAASVRHRGFWSNLWRALCFINEWSHCVPVQRQTVGIKDRVNLNCTFDYSHTWFYLEVMACSQYCWLYPSGFLVYRFDFIHSIMRPGPKDINLAILTHISFRKMLMCEIISKSAELSYCLAISMYNSFYLCSHYCLCRSLFKIG